MKALVSFFLTLILGVAFLSLPIKALAQGDQPQQTYVTAVVSQVVLQTTITLPSGEIGYAQQLKVKEDASGITRDVSVGSQETPVTALQLYKVGQHVVLSSQPDDRNVLQYFITDQYRIPVLLWLTVAFFVIVLAVSRFKGFSSLLGMLLSLGVILFFMVPQIIHGANPVLISIISSGIISAIIIYFGHGFHKEKYHPE